MGGDDFLSDDDLDDIPDNTLQELEQNALSSTQLARPAVQPLRHHPKQQPKSVSIPARPATANKSAPWRPPQPRPQPPVLAQIQQLNAPPASAPEPPSSDYGFDDEDVVDLDESSLLFHPPAAEHTRPNTALGPSAAAASLYAARIELDPETEAAYAAADAELGAQQWAHAPHLQPKANDGIDVSSLQARIAELETEQTRLRQAEQEARNAAFAKQGEIAIVRANQDKATKEYERRIVVMQKLHADEAAKVKSELEAGKKEREKMATDNRFLQHDLAQEAEKAKRLNGPGKARAAAASKEKETPRKAKRTGLGDGFEEDEVRMISPTKSKDRQKDVTPKHGAKRKRTANDSPVAALSFIQPPKPAREESTEQALPSLEQHTVAESTVQEDDRYAFMQRLLSHSPYEGHDRTVEALAKHAFPSDPHRSLSSILTDDLARLTTQQEASHLPLVLSRILLKLWFRCLEEKYYSPIRLILDLISFTLYFELSSVVSQLIEEAVPLCIKSIDLVAVPITRASMNPTFAANLDRGLQDKLANEIDVDGIMDFLLRLSQAAGLVSGRLETFWQYMDFAFTLQMLHKAQPISQIITILRTLASSATSTTFGPVCSDAEKQSGQELGAIDRLTTLIFESPEVPTDEPAYTELEIAELRLEILKVFRAMCLTDHGGLLLAQHRHAIGRLIRFLHGQVDKLYSIPASLGLRAEEADEAKSDAHAVVIQTINTTVRLVYHLLRTYDSTIDFTQKLNAVKGGHHKFLISMTRIAFTEGLVFERGIEEEVVEAAHLILDNMLSPEEGEAIVKAVETPRGTKGSVLSRGDTTERDVTSAETTEGDEDATMSDPG